MFKDLRVVGSVFNPRVILKKIQALRHPPLRDILSGFEGVVRPGEMLHMYPFLFPRVGRDFLNQP
jgi:hypothetical protein